MKLLVDGFEYIETSREVEQLPRKFIDFALEHRSTNGNYFWHQRQYNGYPFKLESIELIDRRWGYKTRALSLKFGFSYPDRHQLAYGKIDNVEVDALCYRHGFVRYDGYYTNLAEGEDICEAIIKLNLDNALPVDLNYLIKRID